MPERPKPNLDSVRDAMRERDDRAGDEEPEAEPAQDETTEEPDEDDSGG